MLDPDILATFTKTIYVAPALGVSASGDVIHGTPVPRKARIEATNTLVLGSNGEELTATRTLFLAAGIGEKDRVWLDDQDPQDDEQGRLPKSVERCIDLEGDTDHYEVML